MVSNVLLIVITHVYLVSSPSLVLPMHTNTLSSIVSSSFFSWVPYPVVVFVDPSKVGVGVGVIDPLVGVYSSSKWTKPFLVSSLLGVFVSNFNNYFSLSFLVTSLAFCSFTNFSNSVWSSCFTVLKQEAIKSAWSSSDPALIFSRKSGEHHRLSLWNSSCWTYGMHLIKCAISPKVRRPLLGFPCLRPRF